MFFNSIHQLCWQHWNPKLAFSFFCDAILNVMYNWSRCWLNRRWRRKTSRASSKRCWLTRKQSLDDSTDGLSSTSFYATSHTVASSFYPSYDDRSHDVIGTSSSSVILCNRRQSSLSIKTSKRDRRTCCSNNWLRHRSVCACVGCPHGSVNPVKVATDRPAGCKAVKLWWCN